MDTSAKRESSFSPLIAAETADAAHPAFPAKTVYREAARHGAAFLTVTLDTGIQVWPDPRVRDNFMKHLDVSDLFYPDRRIAALGERDGFDVLTLAEPLYRYAEAHHAFLHGFANSKIGFGHWNAEGHRVAGELIGERLCAMLEAGKCASCAAGPDAPAEPAGASGPPGLPDAPTVQGDAPR